MAIQSNCCSRLWTEIYLLRRHYNPPTYVVVIIYSNKYFKLKFSPIRSIVLMLCRKILSNFQLYPHLLYRYHLFRAYRLELVDLSARGPWHHVQICWSLINVKDSNFTNRVTFDSGCFSFGQFISFILRNFWNNFEFVEIDEQCPQRGHFGYFRRQIN